MSGELRDGIDTIEGFQLSPNQRRLWTFLERVETRPFYAQLALKIEGDLEFKHLRYALKNLVARHEILRTRIACLPGMPEPVQIVEELGIPEIGERDLSALSPGDRQAALDKFLREQGETPFDTEREAMPRFLLVSMGTREFVLIVSLSAMHADWSALSLSAREIARCYEASTLGEILDDEPMQYADVSGWMNDLIESEETESGRGFWTGRPWNGAALRLPFERSLAEPRPFEPRTLTLACEEPLRARLETMANRDRDALNVHLLAAWQILLAHLCDCPDITVGVAFDGRKFADLEDTPGQLTKYIPLQTRIEPDLAFEDFLETAREALRQAHKHQEYFDWSLFPDRENVNGYPPFCFETLSSPEPVAFPEVRFSIERQYACIEPFQIKLAHVRHPEGARWAFHYDAGLFDRRGIETLADQYLRLTAFLLENPDTVPARAFVPGPEERRGLLDEYKKTETPRLGPACFHRHFERQAERRPDATAIRFDGENEPGGHASRSLSYAALNCAANRLAHRLAAMGVGPETLVGLCLESSPEMVVSLLAIHKAGGAYVPLDPEYPRKRLAFMVENAGIGLLITSEARRDWFPGFASRTLCLNPDLLVHGPAENLLDRVGGDNLAYVIYTSGSTGRPKGVMIAHRSAVNHMTWMARTFGFASHDRILHKASPSFDASVWELFAPLMTGAVLIVARPGERRSPDYLAEVVQRQQVTVAQMVPSLLGMMFEVETFFGCRSLRLLFCAGEALPVHLVRGVHENGPAAALCNMYGPTEATIDVSWWMTEPDLPSRTVPIGKPLDNTRIYILDRDMTLSGLGAKGRMWLAGVQLARGYRDAPDLTADRFRPDPFSTVEGERVYDTGDLARFLPGGEIEFLGRLDHQIKVRGFRIELGEIESVLVRHPDVSEALIVDHGEGPEKYLAAYLVPDPNRAAVLRRLSRMEEEGLVDRENLYELPNGMTVAHQYANVTTYTYREIFEDHCYRRHGIDIEDGACIFDIGANIGIFSLYASMSAEDVTIYSFEPIPATFRLLRTNAALHGVQGEVFNLGLADRVKEESFSYFPKISTFSGRLADLNSAEERAIYEAVIHNAFRDEDSLGETAIRELIEERLTFQPVSCRLTTVSTIIRERGIDRIDLLKIDVEKSEWDVLVGIEDEDWPKIEQIVIEVHDTRGCLTRILNLLDNHGFRVFVDQDDIVKGTVLYNIYATRKEKPVAKNLALSVPRPSGIAGHVSFVDSVRGFLEERLPDYMVPAFFMTLGAFPQTPGGKIDKNALPVPDLAMQRDLNFVEPSTAVETGLAKIWSDLLHMERIGLNDDFFRMGGHSLLAAQVIARVRKMFGIELPIRTLFEHTTLAALADKVDEVRQGPGNDIRSLTGVVRPERIPLSFAQQRLWFIEQLAGIENAYSIPNALRLVGVLSPGALFASFREILDRHESLRTRFVELDGVPCQVVDPGSEPSGAFIDLQHLGSEAEHAARALARIEERRSFDLSRGPLFRVYLVRVAPGDHLLLVNMHHIVSDGWSFGVLLNEFAALYAAGLHNRPSPLPPLPIQYADFACRQHQWLEREMETQLAYWARQLEGVPSLLTVPTDRPRPPMQTFRGAAETFHIEPGLTAGVHELGRDSGWTPFMCLQTAFAILLSRYSGQNDIVIGSPTANRAFEELEPMIGFFVNTLALRCDLSGDPTVAGLLDRVRQVNLDAYQHQDIPFEKLVTTLQPERDFSHQPLFQVMFALQNLPETDFRLPGLKLRTVDAESVAAKFDLLLILTETPDGFRGALTYNVDLFDTSTIRRMVDHYQTLLAGMIADPDLAAARLPLLAPDEKYLLVREWNHTARDYRADLCLHEPFEEQATRNPDAVAAVFADESMTYTDLDRRANRLAHALIGHGVRPGDLIAIRLTRSFDMIVGLLAIHKTGAAYVPMDPGYPEDRVKTILEETRAPVLLTHACIEQTPTVPGTEILYLDRESFDSFPDHKPAVEVASDFLAYIIFTSGSTGKPKGVVLQHRPVINLIEWVNRTHEVGPDDRLLFVTSLCFDLSVYDVFGTLAAGAAVHIAADDDLGNPEALLDLIETGAVTFWDSAPAALQQLAPFLPGEGRGSPSLRLVFLSGDWIPLGLPPAMTRAYPNVRVIGLGGATEAAIWSNFFPIREIDPNWKSIPYGNPIQNARYFILDKTLQPAPIGVPGDLFIGGLCLSSGYCGQPDLTAERYLPDPFSEEPGRVVYNTGDRARWLIDRRRGGGVIEFLGRLDAQVKIRGFRIELGEIETVLRAHPQIREAVVLALSVRDNQTVSGDRRLVAYIEPLKTESADPGTHPELEPAALRARLMEKLPEYMVPSSIIVIEEWPVTSNGKLDRKALPAPETAEPAAAHRVPQTEIEREIRDIWREVLGIDNIGVRSNFFEIGGHSLLATQVVSRINACFSASFPLLALFETPTIEGLAERVEKAGSGSVSTENRPIAAVPRDRDFPLSPAQEGMWFFDQLEGSSAVFNIHIAARLLGTLDISSLEQAVRNLVQRHESLRTLFREKGGRPVQYFVPEPELVFPLLDLGRFPESQRREIVSGTVRREAGRPFDLAKGPLLRPVLIRLDERSHALILSMHHIISDGWSMGILFSELAVLYQACLTHTPPRLEEPVLQYADFAYWHRETLGPETLSAQIDYWKNQLAAAPECHSIPTDKARPPVQTFRGNREPFRLSEETVERLTALSRQYEATTYMTLLSVFFLLIYRYGRNPDIVIGTGTANRTRRELEPLIGLFADTLALRCDLSPDPERGEPTFPELLGRVRETALGAYAHQDVPFEKVLQALQPRRDQRYSPVFQILFSYQREALTDRKLPGLLLAPLESAFVHAKYELTLFVHESDHGLSGSLEYNTDLFNTDTIAGMTACFTGLLEDVLADPDRPIGDFHDVRDETSAALASMFSDDFEDL